MTKDYVHGYDADAHARLRDQAAALATLLHGTADERFRAGDHLLEIGCGVGAQTAQLLARHPDIRISALDVNGESVAAARAWASEHGIDGVSFDTGNIYALPFAPASFDHVFMCFVLEHLPEPERALRALLQVLKPGGTITVIEGDHGSARFYPHSDEAQAAIDCQVALQARAGGDANIGRRLYPLLRETGFEAVAVDPRFVYVDASRPTLVEHFTRRTFTAMIAAVRGAAIDAGLIDPNRFDAGIDGLERTTREDGVFCYTFFRAQAVAPPRPA